MGDLDSPRAPRLRIGRLARLLASQCASAAGSKICNQSCARRRPVSGPFQAVIVWRYAFDMGADVAGFAADSSGLLTVTGRSGIRRQNKSLSFEFSAATAQGPTLQ